MFNARNVVFCADWGLGRAAQRTLLLAQAILNSEFLNKAECESMIRLLMGQLHEEASANDDNDDDHMVEQ